MTNLWSSFAALWLLSECLIILGLASKSSQYRWVYFSLIFSLNYYQVFHSTISFANIVADYGLGCRLVVSLLYVSRYTLLADENHTKSPRPHSGLASDGQPVCRTNHAASVGHINPHPTFPLLRSTKRAPPSSRHKFSGSHVILHHANMTLLRANSYCMKDDITNSRYDRLWCLAFSRWHLLPHDAFIIPASIAVMIVSTVWVGTGISEPRDWPLLFGSFVEAYIIFTSHADFLAKAIRFPSKSKFTSYFKLIVAFFMSGVIHQVGD
ncbi:hypothetical protein BDZ97DRAFT_1753562 [Flammula alnicola]|nr:hypothetical protein BDZ97DRAFT_1753562 [Flammula alnicola]